MDTWLLLLRLIISVVLVVGLAYWATRLLGKWKGIGDVGVGRSGIPIRPLSRTSIGKEQNLMLVQVGERYLLLGATPGGISTLAEFSQAEVDSWCSLKGLPEEKMPFRDSLRAAIKKRGQR